MFIIIKRLLPLFLLCLLYSGSAGAQQVNRTLSLNLGDAVVTGFSGTLRSEPTQPGARNRAPNDFTFINPDGPSVRVIDVSRPGYVWDGRLFAAPKTFDVFAKDVGQVFGVALDDSAQPNIYVAATSVFGLNIVVRGRDGLPERRRKGAPGAGWMKGQFGLDLQGGPGSIYKIDGRTGVPTLFANVTLNGVPNPGPGLGNLAYDAAHKQLFVSDLYTGMIHRFALDGKELGAYDHGVTGLGAAKLAPVAFNPANRPNIASDRFDSEKPDSWGFAPAARRVWGLAVHEDRLYYSVVSGPQIWSVGIERDGSFAADPRWELDVPAQAGPLPVSDIAFSQKGAMILAQRALIAGAYDYSAFTRPGEPQVFRVWLKGPNDPPSPGRWKLVPEEYAVGFAGNHRNTNGGVALGYGYGRDGTLQPGSCEASLWTTGQNLRNNPAARSQLEPGGPLLVHGVQGSPIDMVRNANTPPATSYFADYDDKFDDPRASGHMGSVRVYTTPCAPAASTVPVPAIIPIVTPIGCVGPNCRDVCKPTCICPPGTVLVGKECVPRTRSDLTCPPPFIPGPTPGSCVCPPGTVQQGHTCVPLPHECKPPLVLDPVTGTCVCPPGTVQQGRVCVPQICPPPLVPGPCECPEGTVNDRGICVPGIDLKVEKEDTPGGGGGKWFNVWVTNVGPSITYGPNTLTITENIPAGMTVTGVTGTGWSCVPPTLTGPGTMLCTYAPGGTLPNNTSLSSTMVVHYTTTGTGPWKNCATVGIAGSVGVDTNSSNDTACADVTGTPIDLKIEKKGGTTPVCRLPYYSWTIMVTNAGAGWPATGNIKVTDTVPAGMTFDPIISPPWSCFPLGPYAGGSTFTCTYNGPAPTANQPLPPINITATATIGPPFPPFTQCASVASTNASYTDSNASNDNTCTTVSKPSSCFCPPGQVMNVDGICTCPEGQTMVNGVCVQQPPTCPAPQVPNAAGVCECPAPMTPGAVPGQCICAQPNVMIGGVCVQPPPPACTSPQVPNAAGVCECPAPMTPGAVPGQCLCPQGQVLVGGACASPAPAGLRGPAPAVCPPPKVPDANGKCICPPTMMDKDGVCVPKTDACRPPKILNPATGACECPAGTIDKGGRCLPQPAACVPPTQMNQVTGQCECAPGVVPGGTNPVLIQKMLQLPTGKTWSPASFAFDLVCTGPTNANLSVIVPIISGYNGVVAPTCSQCTITERPQPLPHNLCPPGTWATMLPATYAPSNSVVSGVGTDPIFTGFNIVTATNKVICSPTPPVCQPPLVLGPTGCECPLGQVSIGGTCRKEQPRSCEQGTKLIRGVCMPPPICLPPQVANADGVCGCPAGMLPGAIPGQCMCRQKGSKLVDGHCVKLPDRKQTDKKKEKKPEACPRGTHRVRGKCVKNESKEPRINADDVRRGIDAIRGFGIGGGGGGGRNPGGGGGGTPGKR